MVTRAAMDEPRFDELAVGDELPELSLPPMSRTTLALYAGIRAITTRYTSTWISHARPACPTYSRTACSRQPTSAGCSRAGCGRNASGGSRCASPASHSSRDAPLCTGRVVEKLQQDGERRVRLELKCSVRDGTQTVLAEALVALN